MFYTILNILRRESMYQLFVRWGMEGEGHDVVELCRKDNGLVVLSSGVTHNNRDIVKGYCEGLVAAFNMMRNLNLIQGDELQMPRCLTQRGGIVRHLTADTSRQD